MAERGNTTHGPNRDDQLKHETQGLVQGNHPSRAEDWRESESVDDTDYTADGDQPVYVAEGAEGEGAEAEGGLAEPVQDRIRNDDENDDEEVQ